MPGVLCSAGAGQGAGKEQALAWEHVSIQPGPASPGISQVHRVHSQADLRSLHPPAPVTDGFPCCVEYSLPIWDGDSPNSLPHRQEEELCIAFLRAERSGDPGSQPISALSLLCTKGDRSSCLSGL